MVGLLYPKRMQVFHGVSHSSFLGPAWLGLILLLWVKEFSWLDKAPLKFQWNKMLLGWIAWGLHLVEYEELCWFPFLNFMVKCKYRVLTGNSPWNCLGLTYFVFMGLVVCLPRQTWSWLQVINILGRILFLFSFIFFSPLALREPFLLPTPHSSFGGAC